MPDPVSPTAYAPPAELTAEERAATPAPIAAGIAAARRVSQLTPSPAIKDLKLPPGTTEWGSDLAKMA